MKVFEDYFAELQADMVSICLEYSEYSVSNIYIYCSYEANMYASDIFFEYDNRYSQIHELNKLGIGKVFDVSTEKQHKVLKIINDDLREIHKKSKEFNREMPTEIKLIYDVKKNSLEAKYKYDLVYSNDDKLLPDDIFNEWFNAIKGEN